MSANPAARSAEALPVSAAARHEHLDGRATAVLLACCLFWGFQQVLVKATLPELPPVFQAGVRFVGAALILWAWCRGRGVPLFERDGSLWPGLLVGLLFAGEFAAMYLGLQYTTASRLTTFLYTSPFWVALLLPRFITAEKLRRIQWIGLGMAFTAVAVAFSEAFLHSSMPGQWKGDAMGLAAGLLWGLTTLAIRTTKVASVCAEKSLFYQLGVTAVVTPLLSLALGETWSFDYSAMAWGSVFLQTAVGAFASYLTWMWMLRHYPATQMSTFTFLTPLFALVFGVLLLGEPLTLQLVLALAGVAAGIVLVSRRA